MVSLTPALSPQLYTSNNTDIVASTIFHGCPRSPLKLGSHNHRMVVITFRFSGCSNLDCRLYMPCCAILTVLLHWVQK